MLGCTLIDRLLKRLPDTQDTNAAEFLYERMASQSDYGLPIIYQPFDGRERGHLVDRGQILDFGFVAGPGRVLDFGPGDGWPSLSVAPLVREIVGVDASPRRVAVCRDNAARLRIENARFLHVPAGEALPFEEAYFDGATAASSIEQTPDPQATLREFARVLKPGARLRMRYESLGRYRNSGEQGLWLDREGENRSRLVLVERHIQAEHVRHLGLILNATPEQLVAELAPGQSTLEYGLMTQDAIDRLMPRIVVSGVWATRHPSCRTWLRWLREAGFAQAISTEDGGQVAVRIFSAIEPGLWPQGIADVDALLAPAVRRAVEKKRPCARAADTPEPAITAVR